MIQICQIDLITLYFSRWKTYRNAIADSEDAESATGFWSQSWFKENVEVSCTNLEASGAQLYYTICAVKCSSNLQLHLVLPILVCGALIGAAFYFKHILETQP